MISVNPNIASSATPPRVTRMSETKLAAITALFAPYRLEFVRVEDDVPIPGSYWGEWEAGLLGDQLFWRADTPLHSLLHEAAHFACMDQTRRAVLARDAGGGHAEENAVCYLQIMFADSIEGFGRARMCQDMDAWGYTFRLGS